MKGAAVLCVAAGAMCLLALLKWPIGFYDLLRWLVCAAGIVGAIAVWKTAPVLGAAFIFTAILFNPVAPIRLSRNVWVWIDPATALWMFAAAWAIWNGTAARTEP